MRYIGPATNTELYKILLKLNKKASKQINKSKLTRVN
jgi:hypothetical protein